MRHRTLIVRGTGHRMLIVNQEATTDRTLLVKSKDKTQNINSKNI